MRTSINKNLVLVAAACVYREVKGESKWFLVKQNEEDKWEIPKVIVRRGESSVRAVLRIMGEKGGMSTRVLEEAGRAGGITNVNGKTLPQRYIYYLMIAKSITGEPVGFNESIWLEYSKALKKLTSKREKVILRVASKELKKIKKGFTRKKWNEEEST